MGGVAGGRLAATVTAAGGLGMIGMGSTGSVSLLQAELRRVPGMFGIGLVHWVIRKEPGLLDAALAAGPALLSVSFSDDWSWVERAHSAKIPLPHRYTTAAEPCRPKTPGRRVGGARAEGGGHGEAKVATLPLLDAVLNVVSVPVLAGGASRRREASPPCWPRVPAAHGWARACRPARRR
ncbi:nitronate monooxygenase family protein [Mycobacterium xenopi 4042]|uniref:Nitronate monooxygenase family protein n=1 Tax=Mycobacterium xenopi 4042 TaxID=1299334 RepID=X8CEZ9_MYCXE|nr:nitronate monooxygenase family protein [Mycobacterium xenopi 4042]